MSATGASSGDMHQAITKYFKKYNLFGFTGTPIFAVNAGGSKNPTLRTTEQAFGDQLHAYTIVDAINDKMYCPSGWTTSKRWTPSRILTTKRFGTSTGKKAFLPGTHPTGHGLHSDAF